MSGSFITEAVACGNIRLISFSESGSSFSISYSDAPVSAQSVFDGAREYRFSKSSCFGSKDAINGLPRLRVLLSDFVERDKCSYRAFAAQQRTNYCLSGKSALNKQRQRILLPSSMTSESFKRSANLYSIQPQRGHLEFVILVDNRLLPR